MTWKITKTQRPGWLAVIGPYDEPFIADIETIRGAYFDGSLGAWLVPERHRAALEQVVIKHSPPPLVELRSGAEGVAQVLDLATRLGTPDDDADRLATEGLELGLEDLVDMDTLKTRTVRVGGVLVCVAVADLAAGTS